MAKRISEKRCMENMKSMVTRNPKEYARWKKILRFQQTDGG